LVVVVLGRGGTPQRPYRNSTETHAPNSEPEVNDGKGRQGAPKRLRCGTLVEASLTLQMMPAGTARRPFRFFLHISKSKRTKGRDRGTSVLPP